MKAKKLLVLSLLAILLLSTFACGSGEEMTPGISTYPAEISGHVTIAERLIVEKHDGNREYFPTGEGSVFWIVDILVHNDAYDNDVKWYYDYWKIAAGDTVYTSAPFPSFSPTTMSIPLDQSGESKYLFTIPTDLSIGEAKLCYQGETPYSYGTLTSGTRTETYVWQPEEYVYRPDEGYKELYIVVGFTGSDKYLELTTLKTWQGNSSRSIEYYLDRAPAVINYGHTQTSSIGMSFDVSVITEVTDPYEIALLRTWYSLFILFGGLMWEEGGKTFISWGGLESTSGPLAGVGCIELAEPGKIAIHVEASGCEWWVKVGIE